MKYVRMWFRPQFDYRPIDQLKKDPPVEVWDWEEVPENVVYGQGTLPPRDWSNPQSAMQQVMIALSNEILLKQVQNTKLAHVEVSTDKGMEVVLTDSPMRKRSWLDWLLRRNNG